MCEIAHIFAIDNKMFLCRKTLVASLENHPPKRALLEYSPSNKEIIEDSFYIGETKQTYSNEYRTLTKDFYL
jgi:tRNA1(Val) A37 N6-methylase TrmN6